MTGSVLAQERSPKKDFIANVKSNLDTHENGINPYTIEKRNLVVRVFGDTAVVTRTSRNIARRQTLRSSSTKTIRTFLRETAQAAPPFREDFSGSAAGRFELSRGPLLPRTGCSEMPALPSKRLSFAQGEL